MSKRRRGRNGISTARREFMKRVSATSAVLGMPLLGSNAVANDEASSPQDRRRRRRPPVPTGPGRTLFFNLSHLRGADTNHTLYLGGRRYRLRSVTDQPEILARERRSNAFLRAVPDDQITHQLVDVITLNDVGVTLGYVASNENQATGTWEMTAMIFDIPVAAQLFAYQQARLVTPQGPLPQSNKRRTYGVRAARTLQDVVEEQALVDLNTFAQALVGVHPDLLSLEPKSAAHIHTNYISHDASTQFLSGLLKDMGPAAPAGGANVSGLPPWGTLTALVDEKNQNRPFKKSDGRLNQYYPEWGELVKQYAALAVNNLHPDVKDDPTLGFDVTPYTLNKADRRPPDAQLTGVLWARHDGRATIEQGAALDTNATFTFTNLSAETGLVITKPTISIRSDGRVQITLDELSNWFLRWLGVWVQFFRSDGSVIPLSDLPTDTYPAEPARYPRKGVDKDDAMFLGVVPPAFAVMGIPMFAGSFSPTIYMPVAGANGATRMRIFYTGLGLSGSEPEDPAGIYDAGAAMTAAFNYGVVGIFMAAGASTYSKTFKLAMSLGGGAVAAAITSIVGGVTNQSDFIKGLSSFVMGFLKVLLQSGNQMVITAIVESIFEELAEAEAIDSIPVAGEVARAVAAVVGAIQLAETSIELALSPPAYAFDIVGTHNLSVTFAPDKGNDVFPKPPGGFSMYYKDTILFDNGTPYSHGAVDLNADAGTIPITFAAIPFGGQVNISIGLYWRKTDSPPGQNDWCAGYATTGLVDNTVDVIPPPTGFKGFPITQTKIPITRTTRYIHTQKSALNAQGNHFWEADPDGTHAPPFIQPPNGVQAGLGGFNSITVRQGTAQQAGYVGYAWKASSSGVVGCGNGAQGQFDQMANLNTGPDAQSGYANTAALCGLSDGVRVAYNLLTHNSINLYVDTTTGHLRQVNLSPPGFAPPGPGLSFGVLNLDSTRCLLHPSGHVVSINHDSSKVEVLKLPTKGPQPDVIAEQYFVARTFGGSGKRPGLIELPAAAVITPDGAILVLEEGNNRIQAFDLGGNPIPYFKNQTDSKYFLPLPITLNQTYLDLAAEFTGYLYVLSMDANANHRLDVYHAQQSGTAPIATTLNMNAAKLAVDFWRNVYTLNYEVLKIPNDANLPPFVEPSVSLWVPPPPS